MTMILAKILASVAAMAGITTSGVMFVQNLPLTRKVAQRIFDATEMATTRMVIAQCPKDVPLKFLSNAHMEADFDIQVKDPFPAWMWMGMTANLDRMRGNLFAEDFSLGKRIHQRTKIGSFIMPELHNHHGHNEVTFDNLNMTLAPGQQLQSLTDRVFVGGAHLVLEFPQVAVRFGYTWYPLKLAILGLEMKNLYMTCRGVDQKQKPMPDYVCGRKTEGMYYHMSCESGKWSSLSSKGAASDSWVADKIADFIVA